MKNILKKNLFVKVTLKIYQKRFQMLQDIYKQWHDNMLIISRCGSHYENYEIDTENEISGKTRILV